MMREGKARVAPRRPDRIVYRDDPGRKPCIRRPERL